ncbi:bifunctional glycosyltransferase family 2 protein/CDP-glycerol:glycerophosphate glycerophosphotransferase [Streptomyces sp. AK02-01A]|uniref:bifunctional glycosyltransferase/CDP-glycerol:glycerophosphate glycerophosphotransferase n=1 Tax=Streptomyces sp. AK02-01A TaxID=3028648 RepID=UPI0029B5E099|nr:bifunctional glycosyltransferase family 2 protein/CDP-glycerol:glycerophosphate glycerophosphotransferase [Streptomyces sp. AK02-01A]MDX3849050.1 bifunctional glycosyltransferase family 2 protein/CDP-glycerol:glycerophosphate glycerophosphotransferase [Streptomyces sp. AK02-01A]
MPRFSVIVTAYNVQAYLTDCLRSVLTQTYDDLELIVVDDCSPDGCGAVADEFAAHEQRVTAVHLRENSGLGPARNAGLARATGDYVVFLDGDGTFVPGALQSLADRLKETGGPDVLVYDFDRTYWSGETVRNTFAAPLAEDGPASFQLSDRPNLLTYLITASNKAYRREFVERQGLTFPSGHHTDTAWTYPVLMTAESITTLDRVCTHHQQRRPGLSPTDRGHMDLFDQYDRVFAFVDERPALDRWRPVLHRRMLDHLAALVATDGPVSRGSRAEFFRRARAHHRRYRAPGAAGRSRSRRGHRLLRLGAHRTHHVLRTSRLLRERSGRVAATLLRAVRSGVLRLHYAVQRRLPVRADHAVFAAFGHRGYTSDPAAIERKVRELAPRLRTAWISHAAHQHSVPIGTRRLRPGTFAYWTAIARAKYLVSNADFDRRLVKRRRQILLQTHYGTPLRSPDIELPDRPEAAGDTDAGRLLADADRWDYSLSANRHSTLVQEKAYPSAGTTLEYGHPRNDIFQRATAGDVARLRRSLGIPEGFTAVLYAPANRDYRHSPHQPLDLERVVQSLGPRFVLLSRARHAYGTQVPYPPHPRVLDVSGHPSTETLCLASDALITDFSSLMFDYANLDRPIVVHCDDQEAAEAAQGTYFDLRSCPPGPVTHTQEELIDTFALGHWRGSRSARLRTAFRARFCPYDDGRAAERVVRHVFLGEQGGVPLPLPQEERSPAPPAP